MKGNAPDTGKPPVKLLAVLLGVGGLGGFIFGYNTGVTAGALPAIEESYQVAEDSEVVQGIITTSILLGALIGSAFGAGIGSVINKKRTTFVIGLLTIIGALGAALSPGIGLIVLSRELLGVGVGLASVICTTYVAELAPVRYSGSLGSWFQVSLTFGILVSYMINLAFANVKWNFRWMFGFGAIPGVLICVIYFVMPMAPSDLNRDYQRVPDKYSSNTPSGLKGLLRMFKDQPLAILSGIMLAATLQLTGINAVFYYAPTIFITAGLGDSAAFYATVGIGAWNFLSTFVAIFLVDRVGRKPLLLSGLAIMIVSLIILGFVFQFTSDTLLIVLAMIFICMYITGFEAGIGCLFWPLCTETFRPEYKDAGASFINVLQWAFNILLAVSFPSLVSLLSQAIVFWGFGAVGIVCWIYLFFKMQETRIRSGSVQNDSEDIPNYQFSGPARSADERIISDGESEEPLF